MRAECVNEECDRTAKGFSMWIGSAPPAFVYDAARSLCVTGGASVTLYVDPTLSLDATEAEKLRVLGCALTDYRDIHVDEAVEKQVRSYKGKYGAFPLYSDAFRYTHFARIGGSMWCDADSYCLKRLSTLPQYFVASEPSRHAWPFRMHGLLDERGFYSRSGADDLRSWYATASGVTRTVTNSHLKLDGELSRQALSELCALRTVQGDSGMTVLRKLMDERDLKALILPPCVFNPIASWDLQTFRKALSGEPCPAIENATCLHVFSRVRQALPEGWSFRHMNHTPTNLQSLRSTTHVHN
jgi:hypothetical protein